MKVNVHVQEYQEVGSSLFFLNPSLIPSRVAGAVIYIQSVTRDL